VDLGEEVELDVSVLRLGQGVYGIEHWRKDGLLLRGSEGRDKNAQTNAIYAFGGAGEPSG